MQNVWNLLKNKALVLSLLLGFSLLSCTTVYFEKPVPQQGTDLRSIPADWVGVYISEPTEGEDQSELETLFPQCFRLERIGTSQLLVSSENRLHERDLPRLKALLEKQKADGTLMRYQLSETMLLCTYQTEGSVEQQYSALVKQGSWYILTQTIVPFQLFDLETGVQTDFELEKQAGTKSNGFPEADSISTKTTSLVARKDRKAWYFNTQEEGEKWTLLYLEQPDKDRLIVKFSQLENPKDFKNSLDYFNAITPFRETESGHFEINPDDAALARLLAEGKLFQTTVLRKIGD